MKSKEKKILFALIIMICAIATPANAQWAKAAKGATKIVEKVLKNGSSKNASRTVTGTITKNGVTNTTKVTSGNYNTGRSAAAATYQYNNMKRNSQPQYVTVQCSGCAGRGWYVYNGYRYQCNYCAGRGTKVVCR